MNDINSIMKTLTDVLARQDNQDKYIKILEDLVKSQQKEIDQLKSDLNKDVNQVKAGPFDIIVNKNCPENSIFILNDNILHPQLFEIKTLEGGLNFIEPKAPSFGEVCKDLVKETCEKLSKSFPWQPSENISDVKQVETFMCPFEPHITCENQNLCKYCEYGHD